MIESIEKEIESINNNLSILPTRTKKNKIEFNNYIDQQISDYSMKLKKVEAELNDRYEIYLNKYTLGEYYEPLESIDVNSIKCISESFDSDEKMELKYYIYQLSHYYNDDLDKVNEIIIIIINKFKEAGISLETKDFNYTEVVKEYMNSLLKNSSDIHQVFESLYWESPNLINQIELNFRFLYLKYKNKLDKFYKKKLQNSKDIIAEYKNAKTNYDNYRHTSVRYISKLIIDKGISIADLKEKNISSTISDFLLEESNPKNYDNLLKLKDTLLEYKNLMCFMYIIDDLKSLYEKKQEYKGVYINKCKEITKKEKELLKLNKKINSKFSKKNLNEIKLKRNTCINELYILYRELDSLKIQEYIYKYVNDDTSYLDLLKLASCDFNYLISLFKKQDNDLTHDDIKNNIRDLFEFIYTNDLNIINNISITENKNIPQIISDRYRLIKISVKEDKITQDNIDSYLDNLDILITYYDLSRVNIDLDEISFILYINKLKEK